MHRILLAWRMLTHDKWRLVRSIAGITFAVFLTFAEVGFQNGLYDNQVELITQLNADLVITNTYKNTLIRPEPFARSRLYQARTLPEVEASYPLYIKYRWWKNPATWQARPIRIFAFRPDDPVFLQPDITALAAALKMPGTALIDVRSKPYFGRREAGVVTELADKVIRVVGTFRLGTDFVHAGSIIMSDHSLHKYLETDAAWLSEVELGLVHLAPHAHPAAVAASLRQVLPDDVAIYTKPEYLAQERQYWQRHTPIGAIFGLGAAIGVLIGVIICYQILYTEIVDHLPQFATLKAIGYYNRFVIGVVFQQALLLSGMGFVTGIVMSQVFYRILSSQTGLLMRLTVLRAAFVFGLTVIMCLAAGSLAVRKALSADPAEVF